MYLGIEYFHRGSGESLGGAVTVVASSACTFLAAARKRLSPLSLRGWRGRRASRTSPTNDFASSLEPSSYRPHTSPSKKIYIFDTPRRPWPRKMHAAIRSATNTVVFVIDGFIHAGLRRRRPRDANPRPIGSRKTSCVTLHA